MRPLRRTAAAFSAAVLLSGTAAAQNAHPPGCDTVVSRGAAAALSGTRISSVSIVPAPPRTLSGRGDRLLRSLHVTTRQSTVRRDLRFAAGDTVDTVAVAESMRILRTRAYLAGAELTGVRCGSSAAITIATTDKWSLNPSLSAQASSSYGGIEERNVLGTGRVASVSIATREGRVGGSLGFADPYLFNLPVSARARYAEYGDGDEVRARLRNAEGTVLDRWREQIVVARYRRDTPKVEQFGGVDVLTAQAFHREGTFLLVGRRIGDPAPSVYSILFGADFERASLNAPDNSLTVGPKLVERRYHAPTIGLARRATTFDTVSWLAQRQTLIDVPLGVEMEGTLSAGREDVSRGGAAFGSIWIGRMWVPGPFELATLDFWSSGYKIANRSNFDAASTRSLFSMYRRRGGVLYAVHAAGEKLVNPDPDVRALQTYDPTLKVIPTAYRLSENAVAAELDRSQHLHPLIPSLALDWSAFVAGSYRTASALSQTDHFTVVALGTGIWVVPSSQGSGTLRLDVLYPVVKSAGTRRGFTLAATVSPWLQANRNRDDPRLRQ